MKQLIFFGLVENCYEIYFAKTRIRFVLHAVRCHSVKYLLVVIYLEVNIVVLLGTATFDIFVRDVSQNVIDARHSVMGT